MTAEGPWVLGLAAVLSALAVVVWPRAPGPWHLRHRQRDRRRQLPTPELPEVLDHIALALRGGAGVQPALRQVASVTPGAAGHELAAVAAAMAW
ncbi:MAG: hypothetical protein WA912_12065, partial [Ornithinimicrobium sp.]